MKIVLKWLGIGLIAVVGLLIAARVLFCGPDKSVEKVAYPLAKAVVEYIEKYGVPKVLNEVEGLPYELSGCNKTINKYEAYGKKNIDSIENCQFYHAKNKYAVVLETFEFINKKNALVQMKIQYKKTLVRYKIRYSPKDKRWDYENFPEPIIKRYPGDGICDPKLFRLTD